MVNFVYIEHLQPGMILAKDLYGVESSISNVIMLKKGQKLTTGVINNLIKMGLKGIYIQGNVNYYNKNQIINSSVKKEILNSIQEIYNLSIKATQALYANAISQANDIIDRLIDTIVDNPNVYIDIYSLRVYDDYTYNHSLDVTVLSIAIGKSIGLSREYLSQLALCALLHDIGKMQVPIEIIAKPGKLTTQEFSEIKKHPAMGEEILNKNKVVSEYVLNGVISHHEKFDGTGYPKGLKGKHIPLFGRVIACADVYDALTSTRPYRNPSTPTEAIEYIMGSANRQFDRSVVKAFLKCISPYPVGSCVSLSNGDTAVIIEQNPINPMRPKIFLMDNPTKTIDLFNDENYLDVVIESLY